MVVEEGDLATVLSVEEYGLFQSPDPIRVRYQAGEIRRTENVLYDVLAAIHVLQRDWPETSYHNIGTLTETVIAFRPNSILEVGGGNRTPDSKIAMRVS